MTDDLGLRLLGAVIFAFFFASIAKKIIRPTPPLGPRVRPYTAASRSELGLDPDQINVFSKAPDNTPQGLIQRLYRPLVESLVLAATRVFGGVFDDQALLLKLKQSGLMSDVPEHRRAHEYRVNQVGSALTWGVIFGVLAQILGGSPSLTLLMFILGLVVGASRKSGRVGRTIQDRRERMRIELYTINQLMAIYLRTSGSPILAAQRLTRRGRGAVIDELNEALRLHARGMPASRAFDRLAEQSPEPFASRTYKLLASGSERGADLASALLSLSEDVRDHRRTELRRSATKRQGAMLIPTIGILAPVMLLFVGAPVVSLFLDR